MKKETMAFCERLNIKYCDELVTYYEKGIKLHSEKGDYIIDKERIIKLNDEYNFFRKWFDDVLAAADEIKKDNDLIDFIYTLAVILEEKASLSIIEMPDRQRLDTDFTPMFSLLYFLEDMIETMKKRNLPFQVISDTLQAFDAEINDYYDIFHRSGMRIYVGWFTLYLYGKILRIGRFNFEMTTLGHNIVGFRKGDDIKVMINGEYVHKKGMLFGSALQDDEEGKFFADIEEKDGKYTGYEINEFGEVTTNKITLEGYTPFIKKGDKILSVHIPAHEPLNDEVNEKAYRDANEIFRKCYPEHDFKAFCCFSWMLEKRLRPIMGRETNITRFQDKYVGFPLKSNADGVKSFLYHIKGNVEIKDLPENNSMQKAVKQYMLDGNVFYEKGGIFVMD